MYKRTVITTITTTIIITVQKTRNTLRTPFPRMLCPCALIGWSPRSRWIKRFEACLYVSVYYREGRWSDGCRFGVAPGRCVCEVAVCLECVFCSHRCLPAVPAAALLDLGASQADGGRGCLQRCLPGGKDYSDHLTHSLTVWLLVVIDAWTLNAHLNYIRA